MYLTHFGLDKLPFSLTPNTAFYCGLPGHEDALNVLRYSLSTGEGFIKITGEVGSGKTLLCRKLLDLLDAETVTAYIPNPDLDPVSFRKALARELKIRIMDQDDPGRLLDKITSKLAQWHAKGKRVVLIIDEAQALPDDTLEAVRLLTNLETETEKLLQIILFGQPELDEKLGQKRFRQLQQRITFSYKLGPLDREQMESYLCHRLSTAGHTQGALFTRKAQALLFQVSQGTPRVINILCHKALMVAYGRGEKKVSDRSMLQAVNDSSDIAKTTTRHSGHKKWWWFGGALVVAFALCYIVYRFEVKV